MPKNLFILIVVIFLTFGCAKTELKMRDTSLPTEGSKEKDAGYKKVVFPNGTIFGGAASRQASKLAQIFVDSHNMTQEGISDIKTTEKETLKNQETIKKSAQKIEDSTARIEDLSKQIFESNAKYAEAVQRSLQKNSETAQKALQMIENLSSKQGTGEITIFFNAGSSKIHKGALEYNRLVQFADYLSRESKGRKVLLISIGSASSFGEKKLNRKLAKKRSETPVKIIDHYLVNVAHDFYKVYGIGDIYSPKGVPIDIHKKYQHTRLIAVYETDQIPALPEETAKD